MLLMLELSRKGTLLLVLGILPPWNRQRSSHYRRGTTLELVRTLQTVMNSLEHKLSQTS
jgi:hypothetical protein